MSREIILLLFCALALLALAAATHFTGNGSLDNIKSKTVGDGQHGTARWATKKEMEKTYRHIPFRPSLWRRGEELPKAQGLVLGCVGKKDKVTALVDPDDIHCLMIGASGVGKTAFFLYPNLEYACASGMSFLALDTKGDLARNYGTVATKYYGYQAAVIDLRNPTRSDGYNLLTLINHYMDVCREEPKNIAARAKAEKYAKILSKTIVNPEGDASNYGQNAFSSCWRSICRPRRSIRRSGGTSSPCSSWCRTCWSPSWWGKSPKMGSRSSWANCRTPTRPSGLPEPPSTVRTRR